MTRELIERAALAMGGQVEWINGRCYLVSESRYWNPKDDDGDCFRMECELRGKVDGPVWFDKHVEYAAKTQEHGWVSIVERFVDHPNVEVARRMAAARAAASLPPKEPK
jgi:hypothetical protein